MEDGENLQTERHRPAQGMEGGAEMKSRDQGKNAVLEGRGWVRHRKGCCLWFQYPSAMEPPLLIHIHGG
jgi:hypothetical protein